MVVRARCSFVAAIVGALTVPLLYSDRPFAVASAQEALTVPRSSVTAGPEIARTYDAIFDGRFDDMPTLLRATCPPAPADVCVLLEAVATWWRIQLDPLNTSRDGAFAARADAAIQAMEAWTTRAPDHGEAFFYLGGAYGARAQWRVLRGERIAAARDGKRIKDALERALALDPMLHDAYFGIGLYHYYADVAPMAAKMVRWLLLLPGGNKEAGLQEMLRARSRGQLLRSEADYQLHLIYLWYERQPARALELLRALRERHPRNPHFVQRIAEIEGVYLKDPAASLRTWRSLIDAARAGRIALAPMAEMIGRLGAAEQLDRLGDPAAAVPHLRSVIDARPDAPYAALGEAHLLLGRVLDRLGASGEAATSYRAAIDAAPRDDRTKIAERARAALRSRKGN